MDPKIVQSKPVNSKANEKKQTVQIVILGILFAFLFFLIFKTFFGKPNKPKDTPTKTAVTSDALVNVPGPGATALNKFSAPLPDLKRMDEEEWGRNPFASNSTNVTDETVDTGPVRLDLQGIVYDSEESAYAILNEKIVKKGDSIADNTVKEINPDFIILEDQGGVRRTLRN